MHVNPILSAGYGRGGVTGAMAAIGLAAVHAVLHDQSVEDDHRRKMSAEEFAEYKVEEARQKAELQAKRDAERAERQRLVQAEWDAVAAPYRAQRLARKRALLEKGHGA